MCAKCEFHEIQAQEALDALSAATKHQQQLVDENHVLKTRIAALESQLSVRPATKSWANLGELRERVRRMAERACVEEGVEARVNVELVGHNGERRRLVIQIEDARHIDGTSAVWEWGDN